MLDRKLQNMLNICIVLFFVLILSTWAIRLWNGSLSLAMIFGAAIVSLVAWMLYRRAYSLSTKQFRLIALILIVLAIFLHIVVAHGLMSHGYTWDAGVIHANAQYFAENGMRQISGHSWEREYLATHGNNIPITILLTIVFKVTMVLFGTTAPVLSSQLLNSVAIMGSFLLILVVSHRLFGRRGFVLSWLTGTILLITTSFAPITYTDTLGAFAVSLIIFLSVLLSDSASRHVLLIAFLLGIAIVGGYLIKPTVLIVAIAMVVVLVIYHRHAVFSREYIKKQLPTVLALFCGLLVGCIAYVSATAVFANIAKYSEKELDRYSLSIEHFLALGSLRGLEPYPMCTQGAYCNEYVDWVLSSEDMVTKEERKRYAINLWHKSVATGFPVGYGRFLFSKLALSYSDGTFGAWGEGINEVIMFRNDNNIDRGVRELIGPSGEHTRLVKSFRDGVWLFLLITITVGAIFVRKSGDSKRDFWLNVFRLSIVGLTLYVVIFETRARYLFLFLPVFILLTSGTLTSILRVRDKGKRP